jgi:hypothetical protein
MRAPGAALTTHADDGPTALPPTGRLGRSDTMGA